MGGLELWIDDERVWSGDVDDLPQHWEGAPRFVEARFRQKTWLLKGNYMNSWRELASFRELDQILGLNAGPQLLPGRLYRQDSDTWLDVFLEERVELAPVENSAVDSALEVLPLSSSCPYSASVLAAVVGDQNVRWHAPGHKKRQPAYAGHLVPLLDVASFQRCAIAHLIYLRCTNLADILLRTHPNDPDRIKLILGDHKKCFWPTAKDDLFWVRFHDIFSQLAKEPLDPELHDLMARWSVDAVPGKMPLRALIARRISSLSVRARTNGPTALSIQALGNACTAP